MIRIAITSAAFDALAATLPLGSVGMGKSGSPRGWRRPPDGLPWRAAPDPKQDEEHYDVGLATCSSR